MRLIEKSLTETLYNKLNESLFDNIRKSHEEKQKSLLKCGDIDDPEYVETLNDDEFNNLAKTCVQNDKDDGTYTEYFCEKVLEDFRNFLNDNNISEDEVTEEDINDYFTELFYDMETEEDMNDANDAEDYIRRYFHISSAQESDEADSMNESVKQKKTKKDKSQDKRVVMQQGNVTCLKDGEEYHVFENESDNEKIYSNENEAMNDLLERVGVNPQEELKES